MTLILGSKSPGRRLVLEKARIIFDWKSTEADELSSSKSITLDETINLVKTNSHIKMNALLDSFEYENKYKIALTADTVVWLDDKIYGKASSQKQAQEFLNDFRGKQHFCISGISLCILSNLSTIYDFDAITKVKITEQDELINLYLQYDDWRGKAGAYGLQSLGSIIVNSIEGDYDNIVGLPLTRIIDFILEKNFFHLLEFKKN